MFQKEKMDERQLWIRGNVFQHSFVYALVMLVVNAMVQDFYGRWAPGRQESMLMVWLLIACTSVELVAKEVYIIQPRIRRFITIFMSMCGVVLLVLSIVHLMGEDTFIENGMLSDAACILLMGLLVLSIPAALLVQGASAKAADDEEV